jgi:hypothetical protein
MSDEPVSNGAETEDAKPTRGPDGRFLDGNPGGPGAPRKKPLTRYLETVADDPKNAKRVGDALVKKAARGDVAAFREFADRVEGKVAQPLEAKLDLGELFREVAESLAAARGRR